MVSQPTPRIAQADTAFQPIVPPRLREVRTQAVHQLQMGLFGLCAMLLIVGLANIIMDRARLAETRDLPGESVSGVPVVQNPASDPLADIGVVPGADPSTSAAGKRPRH